jgi:STE24 endopeptidase
MSHASNVTPQESPLLQSGQAQDRSVAPPPPQVTAEAPSPSSQRNAKRYAKIKLITGLIGTAFFFLFTAVMVAAGGTVWLESVVRSIVSHDYAALLLFVALFALLESVLSFPLKLYSGFYLEHKFHLSNQRFASWLWEGVKGMLVGVLIGMPIVIFLYYCLRTFETMWWLPVGVMMFLFSVVLARLAPVLIFPLFYKFTPLQENELREKIIRLCEKVGMTVEGVFVFNMSKNTKKANAAFTGIGRSKRIILGDTLVANFTDEEIETIFAHELGHYKLKHLWVMMTVGTFSTFLGLFIASRLYETSLLWFGFSAIGQLAALPLLGMWLGLYSMITGPLTNMLSRSHEWAADRFAVQLANNKEAFANALQKLAKVNLADSEPHPIIEFLFHSHPSIQKRIAAIQANGD